MNLLAQHPWLLWMVENTILVALLALIVHGLCRVLRDRPAICHALWCLVFVKLVTPPLFLWSDLWPTAQSSFSSFVGAAIEPGIAGSGGSPFVPEPRVLPPGPDPLGLQAQPFPWSDLALVLWLVGSLSIGAWIAQRVWCFRRQARAALPPPDSLQRDAEDLARQLRTRVPRLCLLPGIRSPFTGGFRRPSIYWPDDLAQMSDPQARRAVLGHELAHHRRGDPLLAVVEVVATVIWWWHPLLWIVRERIHEYAEQSCDAWAVSVAEIGPRDYAETLLGFRGRNRPASVSAVGMSASGPAAFRRRLVSVMRQAHRSLPRPALLLVLALTGVALPSWTCRDLPLFPAGSGDDADDWTLAYRRAAGDEASVDDLVRALGSETDRDARLSLLLSLGLLGAQAAPAAPVLLDDLPAEDAVLEYQTLWALWRIGPAALRHAPDLVARLEERPWQHRQNGYQRRLLLARLHLGAAPTRERVLEALQSGSMRDRCAAGMLLAGDHPLEDGVADALREAEDKTRCDALHFRNGDTMQAAVELAVAVVRRLPGTVDPRTFSFLIGHHFDPRVRLSAVLALDGDDARVRGEFQVLLQAAEQDAVSDVAQAALHALGRVGDTGVLLFPRVEILAAGDDPGRSRAARRCLRDLQAGFGPDGRLLQSFVRAEDAAQRQPIEAQLIAMDDSPSDALFELLRWVPESASGPDLLASVVRVLAARVDHDERAADHLGDLRYGDPAVAARVEAALRAR